MHIETKPSYIIYAFLLSEPNNFAKAFDSGNRTSVDNWPTTESKAKEYDSYQEVWNRFQKVYADNKSKLNKIALILQEIEITCFINEPVSAVDRTNELFDYYSKPK